jgi:hypothetical protein
MKKVLTGIDGDLDFVEMDCKSADIAGVENN